MFFKPEAAYELHPCMSDGIWMKSTADFIAEDQTVFGPRYLDLAERFLLAILVHAQDPRRGRRQRNMPPALVRLRSLVHDLAVFQVVDAAGYQAPADVQVDV